MLKLKLTFMNCKISVIAMVTIYIMATIIVPAYATPNYAQIIDNESSFIASCVKTSGAIIMGPNIAYTFQGSAHWKICPYFSNIAANALLENPTTANVTIVHNWMTWVFSHLNYADGSIYDYYADSATGGGTEHPSIDAYTNENIPKYDSIDSYAGTFLTLARKYAEVTNDYAFLTNTNNKYKLLRVSNALYSCIDNTNNTFPATFGPDDNDGLTVAMPEYPVRYIMDNAQVNQGLKDLVWLMTNVYNDTQGANYNQTLLNHNTTGIENALWNETTQTYYPYEDGPTINWNVFYADATSQLFPILYNVIAPNSTRAASLYNNFNSYYPDWSTGTTYSPYPWARLCHAAAIMGDTTRVNNYLDYIESFSPSHPTRWFILESASVLMSADIMQ